MRVAARNWYQRDKEKAASANERAHQLLHWVIDEVIGERRARAFLLRSDLRDELINALYDARVLHILKRAISTHDQPGIRYDVYKLDYGCFVDLVATHDIESMDFIDRVVVLTDGAIVFDGDPPKRP